MNTLTVFKFPSPEGAQEMLNKVYEMQNRGLITVVDAATVTWPDDRMTPKTQQAVNLVGSGALDGAFWGILFGLLFFIPGLGLAVGAAMGALSGSFADYGIDDNFIKRVRNEVEPGTSALFLMSTNVVADRVVAELKNLEFELVSTNLSIEQEEALRKEFGA